jgi:hypothetical protein
MNPPRVPTTPVPDVAESPLVVEPRKRKRMMDVEQLALEFENEPEDFETAWRRLKDLVRQAAPGTFPRVCLLVSAAFSALFQQ